MIIKLIPETEEEIENYKSKGISEIEHTGVNEYLIFGNKTDSEGDLSDFHEWHGGHWYLMNKLMYFYEVVNDNRRSANDNTINLSKDNTGMIKRGSVNIPELKMLDLSNMEDEFEADDIDGKVEAFEDDVGDNTNKNDKTVGLRLL